MEPQNNIPEAVQKDSFITPLTRVTPISKYLALGLFVILPFLGAWVGYTYAPVKTMETVVFDKGQTKSISDVGLMDTTADTNMKFNTYKNDNMKLSVDIPSDWVVKEVRDKPTLNFESSRFALNPAYPDRVLSNGMSIRTTVSPDLSRLDDSIKTSQGYLSFQKNLVSICGDCIEVREVSLMGLPVLFQRKQFASDLAGSPKGEYIELSFIYMDKLVSINVEYAEYSEATRKIIDSFLNSFKIL